jgi:hypothetical protein
MEPEQTPSMLMTGRTTRQQILHGYDVLIAAKGYHKVYGVGKDSWDDGVYICPDGRLIYNVRPSNSTAAFNAS